MTTLLALYRRPEGGPESLSRSSAPTPTSTCPSWPKRRASPPSLSSRTRLTCCRWKDLSWGLTIRQAREWLTIHAASTEVRKGLESFRDKRMPDYEALREATARAGTAGAPRARFCRGCRSAVEPDFGFCPSCGSALIAAGEGGLA